MKPEISAIKNTFEKAGISNLKISENDSILNEDFDSNTLEEEEKSENYHTREPDSFKIIDLITELHKTNENISKRDYDFTDENEDQAQKISFQLSIDKKKLFEAFFTIKEALITLNIPRYNEIYNLVGLFSKILKII